MKYLKQQDEELTATLGFFFLKLYFKPKSTPAYSLCIVATLYNQMTQLSDLQFPHRQWNVAAVSEY